MVAPTSVSPVSSRSPSPSLDAVEAPSSQLTPDTSNGVDVTEVHRGALNLFGKHKPVRKPVVRPPAPAKKPKPVPQIMPLPMVDPDVATAFEKAGLKVTPGSLSERAAQALTQTLRDLQRGHLPSTAAPVPFHQPIEMAYSAAHKANMNSVCYDQLADIRENLVSALSRYCDRDTAVAAAAQARPVIVWNAGENEHGWDVDLQSGGFVDALWAIVGGRSDATLGAFNALLANMGTVAREPIDDTLFASEERFRDLVDKVAAIVAEAQQRQ